jgi:prepilin-type N-terminal cleavage/methylation domain-containing protein
MCVPMRRREESRHGTQECVRHNERGVTLIEALIVVALIAMIAAVSFPSVTAGLDTLRLRSASDSIVSFLNIALDHADRRQQAVEVIVSPRENTLLSRTADLGFIRNLDIPAQIHIVSVQPALPNSMDPQEPRHFLLYPGGSVPGIGIEISTLLGRKRMVSVDPISGSPRSEVVQ